MNIHSIKDARKGNKLTKFCSNSRFISGCTNTPEKPGNLSCYLVISPPSVGGIYSLNYKNNGQRIH